jgi:hypothetical protein
MMGGLIVGGEPRDARLVQELVEEHIRKESCIILLTIAVPRGMHRMLAADRAG